MRMPAPLITMARRNSPFAAGIASKALTLPPPPDWPKIVTLPGSPPKLATLSRTHSSVATRSSTPALPECANSAPPSALRSRNPKMLRRIDGHDDDIASPGQVGASGTRRVGRSIGEGAAMKPNHDRALAGTEAGGPQIERQAVFADRYLVRNAGQARHFGPPPAGKGLRR